MKRCLKKNKKTKTTLVYKWETLVIFKKNIFTAYYKKYIGLTEVQFILVT